MKSILDRKLLDPDFNPFHPICEHQISPSNKFVEYRAFEDYLIYLKIIGERILLDYEDYKEINDDKIFNHYQLDVLSFVIFARILLDRIAFLIQRLLGVHPADYLENFPKLRQYYIDNPTFSQLITELLFNMNWYITSLSLMRNKVIEHNRLLSGSRRVLQDGIKFRMIN